MLSVVIATLNDEALLGRTLAPLVSAAVSGFVREVIVADGGSTDATLEIADDAGCRLLSLEGDAPARTAAAVGEARSDWVMLLPPGVQLLPGWDATLREWLERAPQGEVLLPAVDPGAGWLQRALGRGGEGARVVHKQRLGASKGAGRQRLPGCAILIRLGV